MIIDNRNTRLASLTKLLTGAELEITVGIHEDKGGEDHDGPTNAEVGSYHEFGERSFIRGYFDENAAAIDAMLDDAADRIMGGQDPLSAGELVALQLESGIKDRMLAGIDPELSESTKKRRGEDAVALIDTSQLIGSIQGRAALR